jgi:hypothetical protein
VLWPFFAKDALPYVRRAISFAGRALVCQATILSQEVGADGLCQDHLLLYIYILYIYINIYIHGIYVYIYHYIYIERSLFQIGKYTAAFHDLCRLSSTSIRMFGDCVRYHLL